MEAMDKNGAIIGAGVAALAVTMGVAWYLANSTGPMSGTGGGPATHTEPTTTP
jgi:hypothetical protein